MTLSNLETCLAVYISALMKHTDSDLCTVGTFSMRATRFRLRVGLLSWEKKDGTVAKNQRILDLIPAEYKDQAVNSTKGWRDFNAADIKDIKAGAMKKPQQARKTKRAAQAEKDQEEKGDGVLEDGEEIEYEDEYSWTDAANEQDGSVWPEYNPKDFERTMPALQMYNANTQSSNARQSSSDTYEASVNNENGPSRPNPKQPRKRSESFLDADSDEDISLRERKRRRIAAGAHYRGSEEGVSHHTKPSTVLRQQRPRPSPSPYAARVSSSRMAHPAVGNNILGQESLPAMFGGEFDFSSPPSHQDLGQFYNSGSSVNARCLPSPDSHRNNGLRESVRFPLPSQLAQYDDYNVPQPRMQQGSPSDGYVQPSALLLDQVNSHSFGPDYLRNDINPDLGVWEENAEAYVPETDSYFNGYPEYESPVYEPQQIPSFEENQQTQHGAPVTLPMERAYLQSIPNAPKTGGKRKRTDDSTVENFEGQTRIKRAKGHTTEPAPAPEVWTPGDSPPGAEQFVPTTGLELPTPMYWPVDAQNTEFPQPESYSPDTIPSPFQTNQGDPWNGESFPLEEQGHLPPPVNIQQGMSERYATGPPDNYSYLQTPDHFYINQDAQYGPDEDAYPAVVFDPGQ